LSSQGALRKQMCFGLLSARRRSLYSRTWVFRAKHRSPSREGLIPEPCRAEDSLSVRGLMALRGLRPAFEQRGAYLFEGWLKGAISVSFRARHRSPSRERLTPEPFRAERAWVSSLSQACPGSFGVGSATMLGHPLPPHPPHERRGALSSRSIIEFAYSKP